MLEYTDIYCSVLTEDEVASLADNGLKEGG